MTKKAIKKSSVKKKVVRKSRVEKPYNSGTMTSAGFFGMIRSTLRNKSRFWKPIAAVKQKAKRPYKGSNTRQKFEYQCNICKNYFPDKEIAVDHVAEIGGLTCFEDLPDFCRRLFCEEDGLQTACAICHTAKTNKYMEERRELKKIKNEEA